MQTCWKCNTEVPEGSLACPHCAAPLSQGAVYLAYDRTMDTDVALKVIPQELCLDPNAVADLKRETSIALKLTHENIVRLYTLDTWKDRLLL